MIACKVPSTFYLFSFSFFFFFERDGGELGGRRREFYAGSTLSTKTDAGLYHPTLISGLELKSRVGHLND